MACTALAVTSLPFILLVPVCSFGSTCKVWAAESQAMKDKAEAAKRQAAEDAAAVKRAAEYAARAEVARSQAARGEAAPRTAPPRRQPSPEQERYRPRAASEVGGAHTPPCSGKVQCTTPEQIKCL